MGNQNHEALSSLSPVDWADVPQHDLKPFLDHIFTEAQTVIDSVPSSIVNSSNNTGRARAKTDSAISIPEIPSRRTSASINQSQQLRQEWKEAKVNARENPLGVKVYKLVSKDGKGAWFARRSVHDGLSFASWKRGLEKEFIETMKVQGHPGSGSIRGIGADKRVEYHEVPGAGQAQVFQLSAQFPGPTSPRDFITLLLTSDVPHAAPKNLQNPRQYMIVSKPCAHPDCPPRQGIIRGQYESVELIREVPVENITSKRSWSSADLTEKDSTSTGLPQGSSLSVKGRGDDTPTTVEWLMVTRSDPGGSVPRFMIEKGTPPGIVNDAGKFLNWVTSEFAKETSSAQHGDPTKQTSPEVTVTTTTKESHARVSPQGSNTQGVEKDSATDEAYWSSGLYGMITGAFGAATSVVSGGIRRQFTGATEGSLSSSSDYVLHEEVEGEGEGEGDSSSSETSSIHSFASALERTMTQAGSLDSIQSQSDDKSQGSTPQLKELKRLQERRRKLDEKAAKAAERLQSKRAGDKEKDAAALAKAREKHEKEIAKQELRYRRELRKLEEKREQEERKAEERRKKAIEREEKSNLTLELEKARAERDVALKQVELLKHQVGELQAQNTALVARLGRLGGLDRTNSASTSSKELLKGLSPNASQ